MKVVLRRLVAFAGVIALAASSGVSDWTEADEDLASPLRILGEERVEAWEHGGAVEVENQSFRFTPGKGDLEDVVFSISAAIVNDFPGDMTKEIYAALASVQWQNFANNVNSA